MSLDQAEAPARRPRGRPPGIAGKQRREHMERARAIFLERHGDVTVPALQLALKREGFPEVHRNTMRLWLRPFTGDEVGCGQRKAGSLSRLPVFNVSDELRKDVAERMGARPEADCLANAARAMAVLAEQFAYRAVSRFEKIKIETPEDAERVANAMRTLMETSADAARASQALRAPLAVSNFNDPEPKPPIDREAEPQEERPFARFVEPSNFEE